MIASVSPEADRELTEGALFYAREGSAEVEASDRGSGGLVNGIARPVLMMAALLLSGAAAAETFKCTNAAGRITYSNTKCSDLGLKDAGEVRDRLNVNPAYRPPPRAFEPRQPAVPAEPPKKAAEPKKPPERRCFTVKTPTGTATRCNDTPEDEGGKPGG